MKARVFISSAINEFRSERRIAKNELEKAYPFLEVWVFEEEGASSASLEQSYQEPLAKSETHNFKIAKRVLGFLDDLDDVPFRILNLKIAGSLTILMNRANIDSSFGQHSFHSADPLRK